MSYMFFGCGEFCQNVKLWDVSEVEDFEHMFENAIQMNDVWSAPNNPDYFYFNEDINIKIFMTQCIYGQSINHWPFGNMDISEWDTSNVTNMSGLFKNNHRFNEDIRDWNTISVTNMDEMFMNANSFEQNINSWDLSNVKSMNKIVNATKMKDSLPNWGERYPIANETLHPVPISEPVIENNMDVNGNSVTIH